MIEGTLEFEHFKRTIRKNYYEYVCYVNQGYKRSRFHEYLCNQIQEFMAAETGKAYDILLLSVPPQHGKSLTITETLPSWFLGNHPEKNVFIAGYDTDFAEKFSRRNRDKFEEFHTLFKEAFPNKNVQGVGEWETTLRGGCRAKGMRAGITGNPAWLFIIDDPIKSMKTADSDIIIADNNQAYGSEIRTRIAPGGKLIVIQTRWVEGDTIGYIEAYDEGLIWKKINIPCECIDPENDLLGRKLGDALCPEIGRGNTWLEWFKPYYMKAEGDRTWIALYQGMPAALEGNLLKRDWWKYYSQSDNIFKDSQGFQKPVHECMDCLIMSVDASFKAEVDSDPVCVSVWGILGENIYLIDLVNRRLTFTETLDVIRDLSAKYGNILFTLIEDKANGSAIIDVLSTDQSVQGIEPITPEGGKFARAKAVTPVIRDGQVYLPKYASFTDSFVDQCATFPNGKHDDMVDSMSQALNKLIYLIQKGEQPVNPFSGKFCRWTDDMYVDYESLGPKQQDEYIKRVGKPLEEAPYEWLKANVGKY